MAANEERKEREAQNRRTAILLAASKLFAQKGPAATPIAEIAREAEVAVGTIYQLFGNKDALIEAVAEARAAWLLGQPSAPRSESGAVTGLQKLAAAELLRSSDQGEWGGSAARDWRGRATDAKRRDILLAATEVFQQKGFYGAAMADIAAATGVATGTLYKFFPSKQDLYFTLLEEKANEFFLRLRMAVDPAACASAQIVQLIEAECAFYAANRAFLHIYISTRNGFEWAAKADLGERFHQHYARHIAWVCEIIQTGIRCGELRDLGAKQMAQALMGMVNATLFEWTVTDTAGGGASTQGDDQDLATWGTRIAQLFLGGAMLR